MNYIINPINSKSYSLNSLNGKKILKNYIKYLKYAGARLIYENSSGIKKYKTGTNEYTVVPQGINQSLVPKVFKKLTSDVNKLELTDVRPDGNCGYHAFIKAMQQKGYELEGKNTHRDLRLLISELANKRSDHKTSQRVLSDEWMVDRDLHYLAEYYKVCIYIFNSHHLNDKNKFIWNLIPSNPAHNDSDCEFNNRIIFLYADNLHFQVISEFLDKPKKSSKKQKSKPRPKITSTEKPKITSTEKPKITLLEKARQYYENLEDKKWVDVNEMDIYFVLNLEYEKKKDEILKERLKRHNTWNPKNPKPKEPKNYLEKSLGLMDPETHKIHRSSKLYKKIHSRYPNDYKAKPLKPTKKDLYETCNNNNECLSDYCEGFYQKTCKPKPKKSKFSTMDKIKSFFIVLVTTAGGVALNRLMPGGSKENNTENNTDNKLNVNKVLLFGCSENDCDSSMVGKFENKDNNFKQLTCADPESKPNETNIISKKDLESESSCDLCQGIESNKIYIVM